MNKDVYIDGCWHDGEGAAFENICPSSGDIVWSGKAASATQVTRAIGSARHAQQGWAQRPQSERNTILRAYAKAIKTRSEAIAIAISRDMGKPLWEARTEAGAMSAKVDISIRAHQERAGDTQSDAAFGKARLLHRPHGVMAVLGPFNFPGHLPNGHIIPALLAGNVCVFKPSEQAPSVAELIVEAFEEAGLPSGCLSVVNGGRETGKSVLEGDINGLLFTGSADAGLYFHRYFSGRPEVMLALEMGGNNPLIVWEPCEAVAAANIIFQSAFMTTGQRCSCARRLILPHTTFGDVVLDVIFDLIERVQIGPWEQDDIFMGPVVSAQAANAVMTFQDQLLRHGAKAIKASQILSQGNAFVSPGLIDVTGLDTGDTEVFGPLLQVRRVKTLEEAITYANRTKFGLAGGLICDDANTWNAVHKELKAGILNWNRPTTGASSALPFGGPGHSGNFRPGAYYAADYCAWPQASQLADKANVLPMKGFL